ncbi:PEP-CTERM system TPR-repeat protein PrsT [Alteromonadaceae bacterium M269]|nr:PEP-CTERM system TPR-repeat protein PrsT [Alteromonadaceae bacterium M269]
MILTLTRKVLNVKYVLNFLSLLFLTKLAWADIASDYEKALSAFNTEKFNEAYILLKSNLQTNAEHLPSKLLLGRILLIDGFPNEAIDEFHDVLDAGGDINLVAIPLARAYMLKGEYAEVLSVAEGQNLNQRISINLALIKANANVRMGNMDEASLSLRILLNQNPEHLGILNTLSSFALQQEQLEQAETYINTALRISERDATALHNKGELSLSKGKNQQAIDMFNLSLEISPNNPSTMRALAGALALIGEFEKASRLVEDIEEQTPGDLRNELTKARILALTNNKVEADKILVELSEKLSLLTDAQRNQQIQLSLVAGIVSYLNENYGVALSEFKRYLGQRDATPEILGMLIESSIRQGFASEAIKIIENNQRVLEQDIRVVSLACDLYMIGNRAFKCERLINNLPEEQKQLPESILIQSRLLVSKNQVTDALAFLKENLPNSKREDVLQFKAAALAQSGQMDEAAEVSRALLRSNPDSIQNANLLADILLRLSQLDEAKVVIDQTLAKSPENIPARINQARFLFRSNNATRAQDIISEVIKSDPNNPTSRILAAKVHLQLSELNQAESELLRAKQLDSKSLEVGELLIGVYAQQNRYDIALKEIDRLLSFNRLEEKYLREKINILMRLGRSNEARSQIDILSAIWSDNAQGLMDLSRERVQLNDYQGAKENLERAIELLPQAQLPLIMIIDLYLVQERINDATNYVSQLKKLAPQSANYFFLEGVLQRERGQEEEATEWFIKSSTTDPSFIKPLVALYEIAKKDNYKEGISAHFLTIIKANPTNYIVRHFFADALYIHGKHDESVEHYDLLLKQENYVNKAPIYNNMALIHIDRDLKKALEFADNALALSPSSPQILDTKGWILTKEGNYDEALDMLRQAYARQSSDPSIRYHLGFTLEKMGREQEALAELRAALASDTMFDGREDAEALYNALL